MDDGRLMMEACKRVGKCPCVTECDLVGRLNPVSEAPPMEHRHPGEMLVFNTTMFPPEYAPLLLDEHEWKSMQVCPKGLMRCVKTGHCMGDCRETVVEYSGIGDVTSNAKGTGARYNTGKMPIELVPVGIIAAYESRQFDGEPTGAMNEALAVLDMLELWQRGCAPASDVLNEMDDPWMDCAAVFTYGAKKYVAWNWAKGMPWSVPMACAVRHCLAILRGEESDPESGLPHRGHVACNLVMLAHFETSYPEGDDRPAVLRVSQVDNGDNAA